MITLPAVPLQMQVSQGPEVQHAPQPWLFSEKSPVLVDSAIHLCSFEPRACLFPYIYFFQTLCSLLQQAPGPRGSSWGIH